MFRRAANCCIMFFTVSLQRWRKQDNFCSKGSNLPICSWSSPVEGWLLSDDTAVAKNFSSWNVTPYHSCRLCEWLRIAKFAILVKNSIVKWTRLKSRNLMKTFKLKIRVQWNLLTQTACFKFKFRQSTRLPKNIHADQFSTKSSLNIR